MEVQWPLLIFGLLAGLSMGCLGFACVSILKGKAASLRLPGLIVALAAIGIGGLASTLHMGNPERILYILGNLQSGITQELIVTAVAGAVIVALIALLAKKSTSAAINVLAVTGLVVALVLPLVTGKAYVQGARPAWDTWFLPLMFLGASAAMGMFTMCLLGTIKHMDLEARAFVGKAMLLATSFFAITVLLYFAAVALAPYPDVSRSIDRVLFNDLALVFWPFVIALGLIVPLAIAAMTLKSNSNASGVAAALSTPTAVAIGLACVIAGSAAARMIMYMLGTSIQSFIY